MTALIRFSKPCDECGGTGMDYCDSCYEDGPDGVGHGPCPSCVDGWLPDDETVDRGAAQIEHYLEGELFLGLTGIVDFKWLAEAVLVAAARYQSEEKP